MTAQYRADPMDELAAAPSDSRWIYGKGPQIEEDITDRRGKGGMERQESEGTRKTRGRKEAGEDLHVQTYPT